MKIAPSGHHDREKIELHVSCKDLRSYGFIRKGDHQIRLYIKNASGNWAFLHETEIIKNNLSPTFQKTFLMDFIFQTRQNIKFEVVDTDGINSFEIIGCVETTIGAIMGARKQTLVAEIKKQWKKTGELMIRAEKPDSDCKSISWQWSWVELMNTDGWFGRSQAFLRFFKMKSKGDYFQVHETEVIRDSMSFTWKNFKIVDKKLCADYAENFKVECWGWKKNGKHQLIGAFETSLEKIRSGVTEFELYNQDMKAKTGVLRVNNFTIGPNVTFMDYLRGGTQLNVIVGIDFTASNGDPWNPESLHHKFQKTANQYHQAISSICPLILSYDSDEKVPVYGFGGRPVRNCSEEEPEDQEEQGYRKSASPHDKFPLLCAPLLSEFFKTCFIARDETDGVSGCFPLTGDEYNEEVQGTQGVLDAYYKCLSAVDLSGPTNFAPVIRKACDKSVYLKDVGKDEYVVLLILTDGEVTDMDETIKVITGASELPLSIIIVGLGDAKFDKMKQLDADHIGLKSKSGKVAQRDLAQFVSLKEFKNDSELMARHVLAEVPDQVVQYMEMIGKKPGWGCSGSDC